MLQKIALRAKEGKEKRGKRKEGKRVEKSRGLGTSHPKTNVAEQWSQEMLERSGLLQAN